MNKFVVSSGDRFGRLTAMRMVVRDSWRTAWLCRCDCGKEKVIAQQSLRRGYTTSCGCFRLEMLVERSRGAARHGHTRNCTPTPEYKTWQSMLERCNDTANINYGGRGITVCDRWKCSFENFYADMGPRPDGYSLERKDVNGNYEPINVIWTPLPEQAKNKRNTIRVVFEGEEMCLYDAAKKSGIGNSTLLYRFHAGWPMDMLFTKEKHAYKHVPYIVL